MTTRILLSFLLFFNVGYSQTGIDMTIRLLKASKTLSIESIRALNVVDTFYSYGSKGDVYCDTTVQLTKDIFYSIISLSDNFGVCSYYFVVTIDEKNNKAIASKYLDSACDIDFSADHYKLYDHKIISKDSIQVQQTIIYQKKNRVSNDEEENIERKETTDHFVIIRSTGEIL